MAKGILGRKLGMTQIFDENGVLIPVTVVDVADNVVLQQKTVETDGYVATQVGFETKREKLSNKPEQGHVKKLIQHLSASLERSALKKCRMN